MKRRAVTVRDILNAKDHPVTSIRPTDTIGELARQLQRLRIGAMIVSADGARLDGIISERDIAYGLALHRGDLHTLPVSALMTKQVFTCTPDDKLAEVAKVMAERHVRHVPVKEEGRVVGVISMRDVTAHRLAELERMADLIKSQFR